MKASRDLLNKLHDLMARKLIEQVESGEASSAALAVACRFLKDNGIEADLDQSSAVRELERKLNELGLGGGDDEFPYN